MKILLASVFTLLSLGQWPMHNPEIIYQVSTSNALKQGAYDGQINVADLAQYGDFGIGTFDKLDGEMILLDGQIYQIKADGSAHTVSPQETTPFAEVTQFKADFSKKVNSLFDFQQLEKYLKFILADNMNYQAIKIEGRFKNIKTRSVSAQQSPYPSFSEVIDQQVCTEYSEIEGTLVGYYMPASAKNKGMPGFHFHFISKDRQWGGHVLDCAIQEAKVEVDRSAGIEILPTQALSSYTKGLNAQR